MAQQQPAVSGSTTIAKAEEVIAMLGAILVLHLEGEVLEGQEPLVDAAIGVPSPGHPLQQCVVGHQSELAAGHTFLRLLT